MPQAHVKARKDALTPGRLLRATSLRIPWVFLSVPQFFPSPALFALHPAVFAISHGEETSFCTTFAHQISISSSTISLRNSWALPTAVLLPISAAVSGVCERHGYCHADWLDRFAFGCGNNAFLACARAVDSKPHSQGQKTSSRLSCFPL